MAVEIEGLNLEAFGQREDFPLPQVLSHLRGLSEEQQLAMIEQGYERAAELVNQGRSVVFFLVDDTTAGGQHVVRALHDSQNGRALVEIPEESHQPGGRFPTVLHALEVFVRTVDLANSTERPQRIPYPEIDFVPTLNGHANNSEGIVIPLTVDPDRTIVVGFHPQARGINPEALARGYYQVIQGDTELTQGLMTHTMLVEAQERPPSRQHVAVSVLPREEARGGYRLRHPGRVRRFGLDIPATVNVRRG